MSLKSMTGYGGATLSLGDAELSIEASAVNRRGLEVFVSGPSEWGAGLERLVTAWIREVATRGKISVFFRVREGGCGAAFSWDAEAVAATLRRLEREAVALGVPFAPDAALLLQIAEAHRASHSALPALDAPETQSALAAAVRAALGQLVAMRISEGAFLAKDLLARTEAVEALLAQIEQHGKNVTSRYRETMFERLRQAGLDLNLDDERVLKEIALFADRSDIAEETTRLRSHFAQFRACLAEEQEVGRKLDFLCQEMNREFNTIGSKANFVEITRCVIEGKNELERIREQVQNVE